jgi:tRNA pseudouridine55 synthase
MDGVLIIDKPAGMTSHDVVARVRKIIGERRVGHTGTLDPFATGVLVVLVGRATRLAQYLSGAEKEYEALFRLGYATDTGDITGQRVTSAPDIYAETQRAPNFRREEIEAALAALRGEIEQTPPMYSAKKIAGRKLYELARRGEEVKRQPVRVTISDFEVIAPDGVLPVPGTDGIHDLKVRVVCSAGTYIRTLAEDFGRRLGVGAHVAALRRTRAGRFTVAEAHPLEELGQLIESTSLDSLLISTDAAVSHLPAIHLDAEDVARSLHGVDLRPESAACANWSHGQAVRLRDGAGGLVAVGNFDEERKVIHPSVVIAS